MTTGIFKYFSTHHDKLERFTNGQVYLTPPKYFNDPWDFKLRSEPYTEEQITQNLSPLLATSEAHEFFHEDASRPCFLEEEASEQQNELSKLIGLVCLTGKHLDRLMWAHYGESHKGFVAEFRCTEFRYTAEKEQAFSTCLSPFGGTMKIQYLPEQPVRRRDGSNMKEVCWTKHELWTYEKEWRVVEDLKKAAPHPRRDGFSFLSFKPDDLLRVILGLRACPKMSFQLRQMLNHKEFEHVRKEQVYIDPESRELNSRFLSW